MKRLLALTLCSLASAVLVHGQTDVGSAERASPPVAEAVKKEPTPSERLTRLERLLNPNESEERIELRLEEEALAREFAQLRKAFKGTDEFKKVVALEKLWLAQRNEAARFREGAGSPTGQAGRLEGAPLIER